MLLTRRPKRRRIPDSFVRSAITTILLIMMAVMIVRDILVRRWGSADRAPSDVTERFR